MGAGEREEDRRNTLDHQIIQRKLARSRAVKRSILSVPLRFELVSITEDTLGNLLVQVPNNMTTPALSYLSSRDSSSSSLR